MYTDRFEKETIITAQRGYYLKLKDTENSDELIGKPERIIFSNYGKIPEFEEVILEK